jgi:small subunit ribosomal protein S2
MLTKKEKAAKMLELEKLDKAFKGLKEMKKIPEIIFVIDGEYESQAIKEANSLNLLSFAVSNTNGDPTQTTDIIPANTNSVKSLEYMALALKHCFKTTVKSTSVHIENQDKVSGGKKTLGQKEEKSEQSEGEQTLEQKEETSEEK